MDVAQIYQLVNTATSEVLGRENVISEDLSNIVDVGTELFNANAYDRYVKSLVNHIGRVIFVNRPYAGSAPSVVMDAWEFGSVLEKIQADLPDATENETWELEDKASYDPNIFYKPKVSAKFFNSKVTFEIPMSFTERQVKQSFSSREQLNGFLSMLYASVDKAMTVKLDALVMRTINHMVAETVHAEYGEEALNTKSTTKAVNLLKLYNDKFTEDLTVADALTKPEFIRFATYTMGLYRDRLSKMSALFNVGGKERFTPNDMLHVVMLSDFAKSADVYLQSDTYHNEFVKLPNAETVPYWQGSGKAYDFASVSNIHVTTAGNEEVNITGVLGVMFDRDALGVTNLDRRVTTNYNAKAEFYTNWYKFDAGYFNDLNENFVVFFIA